MKQQRQHQPVKVKDPQTQGHSVRLQPRQSFVVTVSGIDHCWKLRLNSDFLIIDQVVYDYDRDQVQFKVVQKYDLQEWSYISNVFIGNAYVEEKNGDKTTLCVYIECRNRKKYSVLTVINPRDHIVKVEPHQLLQVVLWTDPYVNWSASHNLHMFEEMKYETVINDMRHVYDKHDLFCCEPRAVELKRNPLCETPFEDIKLSKKVVEHHYWYRVKKDQLEKADDYDNGCYRLGKLTFRHFNNPSCGSTSFDVMISLRNSTREKIDFVLYDAITHRMNQWNVRQYDSNNQIIMNPNVSENIDMKPNQDFFYIELPQPSVYFKVFHDNIFWRAESGEFSYFQITELEARQVNGKYVQRFFVQNIMDKKNFSSNDLAKTMPFIGHVKFVSRRTAELGGSVERTITFNFWKHKEGASTAAIPLVSAPLPIVNRESTVYGGYPGYSSGYSSPKSVPHKSSYVKDDDDPLVSEVELEQTLDCELQKGAIINRLHSIRDTATKHYSSSDTESYYWEKRKKKLTEKDVGNCDLDPCLWSGGM